MVVFSVHIYYKLSGNLLWARHMFTFHVMHYSEFFPQPGKLPLLLGHVRKLSTQLQDFGLRGARGARFYQLRENELWPL